MEDMRQEKADALTHRDKVIDEQMKQQSEMAAAQARHGSALRKRAHTNEHTQIATNKRTLSKMEHDEMDLARRRTCSQYSTIHSFLAARSRSAWRSLQPGSPAHPMCDGCLLMRSPGTLRKRIRVFPASRMFGCRWTSALRLRDHQARGKGLALHDNAMAKLGVIAQRRTHHINA
jgi:hypothetical protein